MRSRAVSLPLACCAAWRFSPPPARAAARLDEVERAVATQPEVAERLARLEVQVADARQSLARIEGKLDE